MSTLTDQSCLDLVAQLQGCDARRRGELVRATAASLGCSVQTVYRRLKAHGWSSGRKSRSDKGRSSLDRDMLAKVSAVMAKGRNKRGQPNVPLKEAVAIARKAGQLPVDLSYGQVARRLREEGLGLRHMRAPEASVSRVSRHPNAVWLFDISVAIQWYFRDDAGRKLGQHSDAGAQFYEGKLDNIRSLRRVLHRYLVVDHFSGAYFVRYYYSAGENTSDVVDFLQRAMRDKELGAAYPFRGVPVRIVMDQGPANKSAITQELLRGLKVTVELHAPGNAKASGAVETRHNHWQRTFEGRLATRPARDLEQLNDWTLKFCAAANSERKHTRHGQPPMMLWSTITADQLVEPPSAEVFRQLASSRPKIGTLDNRLWLRSGGQTWLIQGPNVHARQKVSFRLSPYTDAGVRVWDEHERELAATALSFDAAGFPTNGLRHVWDDEDAPGATAPATPAQDVAIRVAAGDQDVSIDDMFDDLDERIGRQAYLATDGTPWTSGDQVATEPVISSLDAREEVMHRLGRPLGPDAAWWKARIGDGLTATQLEAAWLEFTTGEVRTDTA